MFSTLFTLSNDTSNSSNPTTGDQQSSLAVSSIVGAALFVALPIMFCICCYALTRARSTTAIARATSYASTVPPLANVPPNVPADLSSTTSLSRRVRSIQPVEITYDINSLSIHSNKSINDQAPNSII